MKPNQSPPGPWTHRLAVVVFSIVFALLLFWLLGFVLRDIGTWPGPDYAAIERTMVDPRLLQENQQLQSQIADATRSITEAQQQQTLLRDSAANSERTMNQLLDLNRRSVEQNRETAPEDEQALTESRRLFLNNQTRYQEIHERVSQLTAELRALEGRQRTNLLQLETERHPAQMEFSRQLSRHQLRLAALKLGFLLPLLGLSVWLFLRKRGSMYAPLIYGLGVVTLLRVGLVLHEHFPRRYFKYVLIAAALLVVVRVLVMLLRQTRQPRPEWLLKQYREAYQHFLCPICHYPVRRGPLKYLFWNRRSVRKVAVAAAGQVATDEPYTCPVCGTRLFEECPTCKAIRHSLLPCCAHCGADRPVGAGSP